MANLQGAFALRVASPTMRYALLLTCLVHAAAGAQGPGGPAQVQVATVRLEQLAPTISLPGTVISRDESLVSSAVTGVVLEVTDIGERVTKGAPLAIVDPLNFELAIAENENQIAREQSRIEFLERELGRLTKLGQSNIAAKSQIEQAASDLEVARRDQAIADARLRRAVADLARARVPAPFDGIVTQRLVSPGESVTAGAPVARLVGMARLEVAALAPLRSVRFIDEGTTLRVRGTFNEIDGKVRTKVPAANRGAHMFEVRIPVPSDAFDVNEDVRLEVPTDTAEVSLIVPRDALVLRREGTIVYRVNPEGAAEAVPVAPGAGRGPDISVTGGLSAGDQVVVRGAERLRPGQQLELITVSRREIGGADARK